MYYIWILVLSLLCLESATSRFTVVFQWLTYKLLLVLKKVFEASAEAIFKAKCDWQYILLGQ